MKKIIGLILILVSFTCPCLAKNPKFILYVLKTIVEAAIIISGIATPGIPFARTARAEKT